MVDAVRIMVLCAALNFENPAFWRLAEETEMNMYSLMLPCALPGGV